MIKNFLKDEEGMGTVELILIIAALVAIAMIFKNTITSFVKDQLGKVFGDADKGNVGETDAVDYKSASSTP